MTTYIEKVLGKATVKGVAEYLLFGAEAGCELESYELRMHRAEQKFDTEIGIEDDRKRGKVIDLANELTCELAGIYMELGMQATLLIVKEMFAHIDILSNGEMSVHKGVYDFLIKQMKAAITLTESGDQEQRDKAVNMLKVSLIIAEEMLEDHPAE